MAASEDLVGTKWDDLPSDILQRVFHLVDDSKEVVTLVNATMVNKHWRAAAVQHPLWDTQPVVLLRASHCLPPYAKILCITFEAVPEVEQSLVRWNETQQRPPGVHSVKVVGPAWMFFVDGRRRAAQYNFAPVEKHEDTMSCMGQLGWLHSLPHLTRLDLTAHLGNYWLDVSAFSYLGTLTALESLSLAGQHIHDRSNLGHLAGLTNLMRLNLERSCDELREVLPYMQEVLPRLQDLRISPRLVDDVAEGKIIRESVALLTQVHVLSIYECQPCESYVNVLAGLTSLTSLSLVCKMLNIAHLQQLSCLTNLTKLDLCALYGTGDCREGSAISAPGLALGKLTKLKHLALAGMSVKPEFLLALSTLTLLEHLRGPDCGPSSGCVAAVVAAGLTCLTHLQVPDTVLAVEDGIAFGALTRLKVLNMASNVRSDDTPVTCKGLHHLRQLEYLDLSWRCIDREAAENLSHLVTLTHLVLEKAIIHDEAMHFLSGLLCLQVLDMRTRHKSRSREALYLSTLTNLRSIDFSYRGFSPFNKIEIASEAEGYNLWRLSTLTQLTRLDLKYNYLEGDFLTELIRLTALKFLRIDGYRHRGRFSPMNVSVLSMLTGLADLRLENDYNGPITNLVDLQQACQLLTLTSLQNLTVPGHWLSVDGVIMLRDLPRLKALSVETCRIDTGDMERLNAIWPSHVTTAGHDCRFVTWYR